MAFDAAGTIGSYPCEKVLGQILLERNDPKLISKVTKFLFTARKRLAVAYQIKDHHMREYFLSLLKADLKKAVTSITGVPVHKVKVTDVLASHIMCCLTAYYRNSRVQNNSNNV